MNDIESWNNVRPDRESRLTRPLIGWRYSAAKVNGAVSPWDNRDTTTSSPLCILPSVGRRDAQQHGTGSIHPDCLCGFHAMRDIGILRDYFLAPDRRDDHAGQRKRMGAAWAGQVICKVEISGNVTGPAQRPDLGIVDPPGTIRAERLRLQEVHIPGSTVARRIAQRICDRYGVPTAYYSNRPIHSVMASIGSNHGPVPQFLSPTPEQTR